MVFRNVFIMGVLYMKKREKSRYFTFLIYEDSAPEGYLDILESLNIPIAVSPWHDEDEKTEKLTPEEQRLVDQGKVVYKKKHRHCIYIASNPVTSNAVRNKLQRLFKEYTDKNVVSEVKIITTSVANMYAYLTHESKDAIKQGKHIYDSKDIVLLSNFDLSRYQVLDAETKEDILDRIINVIYEKELENIIELRQWFLVSDDIEKEFGVTDIKQLNKIVKENTGVLRLYFDGNYQSHKKKLDNGDR
ncbi:replication protein RepB [Enterococcus cecorum]|nr:replication protein RepB [Enterococcus cecorum]